MFQDTLCGAAPPLGGSLRPPPRGVGAAGVSGSFPSAFEPKVTFPEARIPCPKVRGFTFSKFRASNMIFKCLVLYAVLYLSFSSKGNINSKVIIYLPAGRGSQRKIYYAYLLYYPYFKSKGIKNLCRRIMLQVAGVIRNLLIRNLGAGSGIS